MAKNKDGGQRSMPAKDIIFEDFIARAVKLGAEGEMSPNVRLLLELRDVADAFDHTHDTITDHDAAILLCNTKLGEKADGETVMENFLSVTGCPTDLIRLLQQLFAEEPSMLIPFELAVLIARGGRPVWDEDTLTKLLIIHIKKRGL